MIGLGPITKSLQTGDSFILIWILVFVNKSPLLPLPRFWLVDFGRWLIWWEFWLYLCIPGGEWWRDGVGLAPRHFSPPPIRSPDRRKPASNWDNWTQSDWSGDRSPSVRWHLITARATTLLLLGFIFLPDPYSSSSGVALMSQALKCHISSRSICSPKKCHLRWMWHLMLATSGWGGNLRLR